MRDNGPVTGNEIPVKDGDELVSATNTKGVITFCNDTFCRIALRPRPKKKPVYLF